MDTQVKDMIKILDSFESYFENISAYLREYNIEKYSRLTDLIERAAQIKRKLTNKLEPNTEGVFRIAHAFAQLASIMSTIYKEMNFEIPISDDISKTKAYSLLSLFEDITKVYKVYVRDIDIRNREFINSFPVDLKESPENIQKMFHAYPFAIDLYVKFMNAKLEVADKDETIRIMKLVEIDKSRVLGEPKWTSIFLGFGLLPMALEKKWYSISEIFHLSNIILASPTLSATTVANMANVKSGHLTKGGSVKKLEKEDWSEVSKELKIGVIEWRRPQAWGLVYNLPTQMDFTRGICMQDSMTPLEEIHEKDEKNEKNSKKEEPPKWEFRIHMDTAQEFLCVETLDNETWRVLGLNGQMRVPREAVVKLIDKHNGRPFAYNSRMEKIFLSKINDHIRGAFSKDLPKEDIQPHIQLIHAGLVRWVQDTKGTLAEKLKSDAIVDKLRELLMEEIDTPELETFLYNLLGLETQFQKDFASLAIPPGSNDEQLLWFASKSKDILTSLLKRHENIFQTLYQKAYMKENMKYLAPENLKYANVLNKK